MKLGSTARTILIVGIFAFASYIIYQMKVEAESAQANLEVQLGATEQVLPQLASEKEDLQNQIVLLESTLAEATSAFEASKSSFPEDIQSIEYDEEIVTIAHLNDLEVIMLTASEPRSLDIDGVQFTNTTFTITVEGIGADSDIEQSEEEFEYYIYQTVNDILAYFNATVNGSFFTTGTVDMVNLDVPEVPIIEDEETTGGESGVEAEAEMILPSPATATISINIYSYGGEE
jgi:hypothetical protein